MCHIRHFRAPVHEWLDPFEFPIRSHRAVASSVSPDQYRRTGRITAAFERVSPLTDYLIHHGFTGPDAAVAAQGRLYGELELQVSLLAFMDCFRVIGWLILAVVPLMLLVRSFKVRR